MQNILRHACGINYLIRYNINDEDKYSKWCATCINEKFGSVALLYATRATGNEVSVVRLPSGNNGSNLSLSSSDEDEEVVVEVPSTAEATNEGAKQIQNALKNEKC